VEATSIEGGREAAACRLEAGTECDYTDCQGDWVRKKWEGGREEGEEGGDIEGI